MAISLTPFIEPKRKKQYLFLLLGVLIIGALFLVWNYFLAKPAPIIVQPTPPPEIKINFEMLKSPVLEQLQLFEVISSFEGEIGRENPFLPY